MSPEPYENADAAMIQGEEAGTLPRLREALLVGDPEKLLPELIAFVGYEARGIARAELASAFGSLTSEVGLLMEGPAGGDPEAFATLRDLAHLFGGLLEKFGGTLDLPGAGDANVGTLGADPLAAQTVDEDTVEES